MEGDSHFWMDLAHFGPECDTEEAIKIIEDFVDSSEHFVEEGTTKSNHKTFMDWHGPGTDPVGFSVFLVSRLIQTENLDTPAARKETRDAILETDVHMFHFTAGKGTHEADPDATSILPAWRKTVLHLVVPSIVPNNNDPEDWKNAALCASWKMKQLREITPSSGAYLNEADYYEPNWPENFFGVNYERLVEIKENYDPKSMFQVWNGIGGLRAEDDNPDASELNCQ